MPPPTDPAKPARSNGTIVPFPGTHAPAPPGGGTGPADGPAAAESVRGPVLSIRWIVACAAVALITLAVLAVGAVSERNTREALTREVQGRLLSLARNLALSSGEALLSDFPELTLHPLALEMQRRQPELERIVVIDLARHVQGDTDPRRLGSVLEQDAALRPVDALSPLRPNEHMLSDGRTLVARVPVTHRDGRVIGTAMVGLRLAYVDGVIGAARRQQSIVLIVAVLLGALAAGLMMSHLLRPVEALRAGIERIGRGDLGTPVRLRDRTELGLLADAVNHMAGRLRQAQVELVERERLAHELELARQIQSSLLPSRRRVAGPFVIQGSNRAAQEVGGDYFDFFELPDGRIGLAIADVSGKGLAGCMVMSMLSALLRAYRDRESSPSALLATLDARLSDTLQSGSFVTMFYGVLDPVTGELVFANAGHSPLLVFRRATGTMDQVATRGIPLGAIRGGVIRRTLEDRRLTLGAGDVLLQYTDGVNEAFEPTGSEQFGFERLERVVTQSAPEGGAAVLAAVHGAVERWVDGGPAFDDETMLVVAHEGAAAGQDLPVLALLAAARTHGRRLELTGRLQDLDGLRPWLEQDAVLRTLAPAELEVVIAALHEALANVAEHGLGCDDTRRFELWSLPAEACAAVPEAAVLAHGCYVIRDDGRAFQHDRWTPTDFADREKWKRGRGIGLDIIYRGARQVAYRPATPEGNVTLLAFDPDHLRQHLKERRHA